MTCSHERIVVFRDIKTHEPASLWACADCGARFQPLAEVEALRADAERFDWMATNLRREASIRLDDGTFRACMAWSIASHGDDLRAAVDAARGQR